MKRIKKLWIGLVCFILIILNSGCLKTAVFSLEYEELKEKVVRIEIGYVHDLAGRPFETLAVLSPEEIDPFLREFCELSFAKYVPPRNESGESVRLVYQSNAYDVISVYGGSVYNEQGEYETYGVGVLDVSKSAFLELIDRYIVEE